MPLVHLRALGERVVLGVLDDRQVERRSRTRARGASRGCSSRTRPSSLTATAPASLRSAISVRRSPFWPIVIAAIGWSRTLAERARLGDEHLGHDARVVDGARVRHAAHVDEPARGRGAQPARRRLPCPRHPARAGARGDRRNPGGATHRGVRRPGRAHRRRDPSRRPVRRARRRPSRRRRPPRHRATLPGRWRVRGGRRGLRSWRGAPAYSQPGARRRPQAERTIQNVPTAPTEPRPMAGAIWKPVAVAGVVDGSPFGCVTRRTTPAATPTPPTMNPTVESAPIVW